MKPSIPVVICDDSQLARNQMSRALEHWNVDITFAEHGLKALEAIRQGKGHLLFLDLTMPIMDGYEVLERIRRDDLPCITIVVSGDVQTSARNKVLALGAIGFIAKPITATLLSQSLRDYGLLDELEPHQPGHESSTAAPVQMFDKLRELANIAMGRTASQLADMLGIFIHLPVPKVDMIRFSELLSSFRTAAKDQSVTTVTQGFVGAGISGEALLVFQESSIEELAQLLDYEDALSETAEREVLMEVANVLTGAFFSNLSKLFNLSLSRNTPRFIDLLDEVTSLAKRPVVQEPHLCIEIDYQFGEGSTHCDLFILFTEDSLSMITEQLEEVI